MSGSHTQEISQGFRLTTNNRMEVLAAIEALTLLEGSCTVSLYSDSKYLVDSISKGWAKKWQANHWKKSDGAYAKNQDLWARLLELNKKHTITFNWVKGHSDNEHNNRCDELATTATKEDPTKIDTPYEKPTPLEDPQTTLF